MRRLRPKAAAVLRHLLERAGEVCTHEELLAALWPGVSVTPGVLKVHVWEIRQALRESRRAPRFLQTVPQRGYRWIAPVTVLTPEGDVERPRGGERHAGALVGRRAELVSLQRRLDEALGGARQVVFVTGEPGIGKTALVEAFVLSIGKGREVRIASGQCIEHYGPGEAYLPVLAALGQLGRGAARRQLVGVLRRHAPTWLAQLPALLGRAELDEIASVAPTATRERMLRELAEALEALSARRGVVLVLEDLQWSDASTLDLLSLLARRKGRARLLVLATYRPLEAAASGHPLESVTRELAAHRQCSELPLGFLGEEDVAAYLEARLPDLHGARIQLRELAGAIHRRTEGNPLFLVNVVDDLFGARAAGGDCGPLLRDAAARVERGVPPSLRQMIEARIERCDADEQLVLEGASAAGAEFSAAALAAALEISVEEAEERCARLVRRAPFLQAVGTDRWPDGTLAARFGFVHALYQSVLHERLTPARRRRFHQRIAEAMERAFGRRADAIAAELAVHFEEGQQLAPARHYLERAADNALRKHADAEAARHLAKALALLEALPETPERALQELDLQVRLGARLLITRGYAAPEVIAAYGRALELCEQIGESPQLLLALTGIYRFLLVRAELRKAREIGEQVLRLGEQTSFPLASLAGCLALALSSFGMGEFATARRYLADALRLVDPAQRSFIATSFGDDPAVVCHAHCAMSLWFLGHPDQALQHSRQSLACARESAIPHTLVFGLNYAVWCRLLRREGALAREHADELVRVARDNDLEYWVAQGTAIRGWVLLDQGLVDEGIAEVRAGIAAYEAIGAELLRPWHLVRLAEAYGALGDVAQGLAALDEARATMDGKDERFYEAELHRLRGELLLGQPRGSAPTGRAGDDAVDRRGRAERCFHDAIGVA
ncbi:MAG: AAA family ATPase, partial [Thermodesulfobacteriota bacterium]